MATTATTHMEALNRCSRKRAKWTYAEAGSRRLFASLLLTNRDAVTKLLIFVLIAGMTAVLGSTAIGQIGANKPGIPVGGHEPNLPTVFLEAKEQIVSERKVPCTLKIVCPKGSERGNIGPLPGVAGFHGATSQGFPKKSFSIALAEPAQLLDMRTHDNWILNAAYIDRSLMRHKLSFDLFRSLSSGSAKRFAVASRFVEVYLNGSYNGAYLLMERVDKQLLELRDYRSSEANPVCIYKAINHAANFGEQGHSGYEQREPDPAVRTYWEPLDEFNRFVIASPTGEFFNPQTGIESRLDLDNAIDFHLLVLLTCNMDGITKNFYLARNGQESGPPNQRFFFAPWDYDGTFGRNWNATVVPPSAWLSNNLFDRLLGNATYREKFVARWNYLRDHAFSVETIRGMIDNCVRTLGDAAHRNVARWPTAGGPYPDKLTFEEDISQMKLWTEARIKWLDRQINQNLGRHHK